jgi:3-hydroxyisobutyrate dehydrogenase-like beta-hydroxyacid dehydrogenase
MIISRILKGDFKPTFALDLGYKDFYLVTMLAEGSKLLSS